MYILNQSYKFLFVTASTGGHIFPILSVASKLREKGHQIHWVISGSTLEKETLSSHNFTYSKLPVGRLRKGVFFLERFTTILLLPFYFIRSYTIIKKYQPDMVMASGGAVSGPILLTSSLLKYRTCIWELNAVSGFTNKILSSFVHKIFICFDSVIRYYPKKQCIQTLFPVRDDIIQQNQIERSPDGYSHLLVIGGSQGAHTINKVVLDMIQNEDMRTWKVIHQTGEKDFPSIQSIYEGKENLECQSFYKNIAENYQWADIVICRAGASTLAELSAIGKAVITIPLSTASDNHQLENAISLYKKSAVELIEEKDLTASALFEKIMSIHGMKKKNLEESIKKNYSQSHRSQIENELIRWIQES